MSTPIPAGLAHYQRSMLTKYNDKPCAFCATATVAFQDYAALTNGSWITVCGTCAASTQIQVRKVLERLNTAQTGVADDVTSQVAHLMPAMDNLVAANNGTASDNVSYDVARRLLATLDALVKLTRILSPLEVALLAVADNIEATPVEREKAASFANWLTTHAALTEKQQWSADRMIAKYNGSEVTVTVPVDGIDLSPLKQYTSKGLCRFAVPGGDTRLKLRVKFANNGVIYVDDAAEYGQGSNYGSQRPGQAYQGKVQDALRAIIADPAAAVVAYTALVGRCGICHRKLEAGESVERGIGPVCWGKLGL